MNINSTLASHRMLMYCLKQSVLSVSVMWSLGFKKGMEKMEPREHRIRPVGESENTHWGDTGDARGLQWSFLSDSVSERRRTSPTWG